MDFDATNLYPSAMWDENSTYPKLETGYACTEDMKDELVENFNTQTFTSGSAILKQLFCNPSDLMFQHPPVRKKVRKTETKRMRNRFVIDTLNSVDIQENVNLGCKVVKIYDGIIYKKN